MRTWAPIVLLVAACGDDATNPTGATRDIFVNLGFESIAAREAVFSFDTTVETSCEAEVGTDGTGFDQPFEDPDMDPDDPYAFDHRVPLTGLDPATTYFVRARAVDRDGREYLSEPLRFVTADEDEEVSDGGSSGGDALNNLALLENGTTVADVSSIFGSEDFDSTWGIHKALDGSVNSEWSSHGDGDDAHVELDLGAPRIIRELRFQSRKMSDGSSIIRSVRLVLDAGVTVGPLPTPDPDTMYAFSFDPPLRTRSVALEAVETTGGNTGAKEIQLLGDL